MYSFKNLKTRGVVTLLCLFINSGCGVREIASLEAERMVDRFIPEKSPAKDKAKESADALRRDPEVSPFLNDPALTEVTKEYGQSVIKVRDFPFRSAVATSAVKPWSAWWYPKREDFMFNDRADNTLAPLTKYDLLRTQIFNDGNTGDGTPPKSAAEFEREIFDTEALAWEGLCDAWALASLTEREPKKPVTYFINGEEVTFTVADLKGLLLKTYEAIDGASLKYFGQRFTGDERAWIYPDIFPDQFHRFVEVQLFEREKPFIMDHDAGPQVWNVPVYKANFLMENVPNEPNSISVKLWLYYASSTRAHEKNFVGTKEVVRQYQYVLTGTRNVSGDLVIDGGHWIKGDGGDSRKDHPDYVIQLPNSGVLPRKSLNPELDLKLIDEILAKSYE